MSELRTSLCKSCGAPIVWARTATADGLPGKNIPLDPTPEKRFVFLSDDVVKVKDTYVTHFSSCPDAAAHRRRP